MTRDEWLRAITVGSQVAIWMGVPGTPSRFRGISTVVRSGEGWVTIRGYGNRRWRQGIAALDDLGPAYLSRPLEPTPVDQQ